MDKEQIKNQALLFINKIREAVGLEALSEILRGMLMDAFDCPVTNSIKFGWREFQPDHFRSVESSSYSIRLKLFGPEYRDETARKLEKAGVKTYRADEELTVIIPLFNESPLRNFVILFDKGEYPELIEEE